MPVENRKRAMRALWQVGLMDKDEVGRTGENLAAELVAGLGYQILNRNWRTAVGQRRSGERRNQGELDLVALDGHTLVGIEVKTRSTMAYGHPAEAFTPQKVARLKRLLGQWLAEHRDNRPHFTEIRLDAIAILLNPAPQITHFKGIS